jgi:hypothetical protein
MDDDTPEFDCPKCGNKVNADYFQTVVDSISVPARTFPVKRLVMRGRCSACKKEVEKSEIEPLPARENSI